MPAPYPQEFRDDVVAVARGRDSAATLKHIADDFGISETTLSNWLKSADVEAGRKPGVTSADAEELRRLKYRNKLWSKRTRCSVALRPICRRRI